MRRIPVAVALGNSSTRAAAASRVSLVQRHRLLLQYDTNEHNLCMHKQLGVLQHTFLLGRTHCAMLGQLLRQH
jgi:hypothetical protein